VTLARVVPVFPDIENRRSMIYIENLCYFLMEVVEKKISGTFFPQNSELVCTAALVRRISLCLGRKIRFTRRFNGLLPLFFWIPEVNKLFADLAHISEGFELVNHVGFEEGVRRSVKGSNNGER